MSTNVQHRPFLSAAEYYVQYRPSYSCDLIARVIDLCQTSPSIAFDLGCGTGGIALPLSQRVKTVYAIDPEPAMLSEARKKAAEANVNNIVFIEGKAEEMPADLPAPQLVTMGQCFHWMDRQKVLQILAERLDPCGVIVLATQNTLGLIFDEEQGKAKPEWIKVLHSLLREWCGQTRWKAPDDWVSHEEIARISGWETEKLCHSETYHRTADDLVGLCLSFSWCSPEKLGDKKSAFESALRAALLAVQPDNHFFEETDRELLVLRRKGKE
ncbi:MAG: class I SAM-dependent methyltransferase [Alphaproteobacteria bacterium]|nr:class I SAM-dependent methyltransferase [Alphaproteobacteria bacterium]